jgi:hypothetical protein
MIQNILQNYKNNYLIYKIQKSHKNHFLCNLQ